MKPRIALRVAVKRFREKVYRVSVTHAYLLDFKRTVCGRYSTSEDNLRSGWNWNGHTTLEAPEIPIVTCVKCLDKMEKKMEIAEGKEVIRRSRTTTQIFVRSTTVKEE